MINAPFCVIKEGKPRRYFCCKAPTEHICADIVLIKSGAIPIFSIYTIFGNGFTDACDRFLDNPHTIVRNAIIVLMEIINRVRYFLLSPNVTEGAISHLCE